MQTKVGVAPAKAKKESASDDRSRGDGPSLL
jgi:hypothetical protein